MTKEDMDYWQTPAFRQSVVAQFDAVLKQTGVKLGHSSSDFEYYMNVVCVTKEQYMKMCDNHIQFVLERAGEIQYYEAKAELAKKKSIMAQGNQGQPAQQGLDH